MASLARELDALRGRVVWKSKSDGDGWSCITIKNQAGSENPHLKANMAKDVHVSQYVYTAAGNECPMLRNLLDGLGTDVYLVRYLKLRPGELVKFHTDDVVFRDTSKMVRLHLPVVTNSDAVLRFGTPLQEPARGFMIWDAQQVWETQMPEGYLWFTNVNALHSVYNGGSRDRIHLVVDVKPHPWLANALATWARQN